MPMNQITRKTVYARKPFDYYKPKYQALQKRMVLAGAAEGMKGTEIAERLGIPVSSVYNVLSKQNPKPAKPAAKAVAKKASVIKTGVPNLQIVKNGAPQKNSEAYGQNIYISINAEKAA